MCSDRPRWRLRLCSVALAVCTTACSTAHYDVNAPLTAERRGVAYALRHLQAVDNSDSLLVVATFSGGGYRAAAMAHAAIEVLAETRVEWEGRQRTLLQELDAISAVSGGSLAAASFAHDPDAFVATFRAKVLEVDLESALLDRVLSPAGLWRQTSATYGRGDLLQEVLDEHVFHGLRYADLPRRRPMVSINATHLRFGERFEFSQDQFDHLCSDLDSLPVARAVAASMAVPLLMSPVTLWNHRTRCPAPPLTLPVRGRAAASPYVHLVDGGLSDNTGLHAVLENVAANGGLLRAGQANGLRGVRKRIFIIVNAQIEGELPTDESPHTPGLIRQLRSVVDVPIDRHADASVQLLKEAVGHWQRELDAAADTGAMPFHLVEISMARPRDAALGAEVRQIRTGLSLLPGQIDTIRRFVRRELDLNDTWQQLKRALRADADTETAARDGP